MASSHRIETFDFPAGMEISSKYKIVKKLGEGWEGEVYQIVENLTGILRAAKFFFPQRNVGNKSARSYALKLHRLRSCSILIQYLTQGKIIYQDVPITYLVSEFVEGMPLDEYLKNQKGKRLGPFQSLHLLHSLAKGIDEIHNLKEYHGDLHLSNIMVQRFGLGFELKVLDFYHWGGASKENRKEDLVDLVHVFYQAMGGKKYYKTQPKAVKQIILGLKRTLIIDKFKSVGQLKTYIENLQWD